MKKLLAGIAGIVAFSFLAPIAFAAYNDVTPTTSAVLSVNGITLDVSGSSSSVIQSITVNTTSFSFTLGNGSSFQVTAPNRNELSASTNTGSLGSACDSSQSFIYFGWGQAGTETVTVTPSTTICGASSNSGGGGGGGGSSGGSFVLPYLPPASTTPDIFSTPITPVVTTGLSTSTTTIISSSKFTFLRNLTLGSKGPDVLALQQYLNSQLFIVAHSGLGSPGHESSYFGRATQLAVMKFQKYNHLTPISGFFGPKTRALINASP